MPETLRVWLGKWPHTKALGSPHPPTKGLNVVACCCCLLVTVMCVLHVLFSVRGCGLCGGGSLSGCLASGDLPLEFSVLYVLLSSSMFNKEHFLQQRHGYPCTSSSTDPTVCICGNILGTPVIRGALP